MSEDQGSDTTQGDPPLPEPGFPEEQADTPQEKDPEPLDPAPAPQPVPSWTVVLSDEVRMTVLAQPGAPQVQVLMSLGALTFDLTEETCGHLTAALEAACSTSFPTTA